jgi:hypothetical protein
MHSGTSVCIEIIQRDKGLAIYTKETNGSHWMNEKYYT